MVTKRKREHFQRKQDCRTCSIQFFIVYSRRYLDTKSTRQSIIHAHTWSFVNQILHAALLANCRENLIFLFFFRLVPVIGSRCMCMPTWIAAEQCLFNKSVSNTHSDHIKYSMSSFPTIQSLCTDRVNMCVFFRYASHEVRMRLQRSCKGEEIAKIERISLSESIVLWIKWW